MKTHPKLHLPTTKCAKLELISAGIALEVLLHTLWEREGAVSESADKDSSILTAAFRQFESSVSCTIGRKSHPAQWKGSFGSWRQFEVRETFLLDRFGLTCAMTVRLRFRQCSSRGGLKKGKWVGGEEEEGDRKHAGSNRLKTAEFYGSVSKLPWRHAIGAWRRRNSRTQEGDKTCGQSPEISMAVGKRRQSRSQRLSVARTIQSGCEREECLALPSEYEEKR